MDTRTDQERYARWCAEKALDDGTRAELATLSGQADEIKMRFGQYLTFGTAGLRGVMQAGTNAMNRYTVRHATQGLAAFIQSCGQDAMWRGVAIAHDCRNNARLFAEEAASVLAANGISVYLFDSLRPTPLLSFAVLQHGCIAGINITASHNPKQYNGYKVYWEDGAQISGETAEQISKQIAAVDLFEDVKLTDLDRARAAGLVHTIGAETDEAYLDAVAKQAVDPSQIPATADRLRVVYTPLFGTGREFVPRILEKLGLTGLSCVAEQMVPDGNFPGVAFPNPEYAEAFELGRAEAERVGADLVIATDPDADRVGVMVRGADGSFTTITGNQMGCLLLDYIISSLKTRGALPKDAYAVKSIVSTALADRICEANGVALYSVFTGFKYIAQVIEERAKAGCDAFLLGFEESYGYLRGSYVKDKDAVVASMLICEMAAYYCARGMTLADALEQLYQRYGYYADAVDNFYMEGVDGPERRAALMHDIRVHTPRKLAGEAVVFCRDYLSGTETDFVSGSVRTGGMDGADMLVLRTDKHSTVIVRPSGTEPKIKVYYQTAQKTAEGSAAAAAALSAAMHETLSL